MFHGMWLYLALKSFNKGFWLYVGVLQIYFAKLHHTFNYCNLCILSLVLFLLFTFEYSDWDVLFLSAQHRRRVIFIFRNAEDCPLDFGAFMPNSCSGMALQWLLTLFLCLHGGLREGCCHATLIYPTCKAVITFIVLQFTFCGSSMKRQCVCWNSLFWLRDAALLIIWVRSSIYLSQHCLKCIMH